MKIKATTPCYKFRDATLEEQIAKLKEEFAEVEAACTEFKEMPSDVKLLALLMEIIDLIRWSNLNGGLQWKMRKQKCFERVTE